MDIESKLDEDFVFYLGFVNSYLKHIRDKEIKHKCELWLRKLCGEIADGVDIKRGRNIYLSQLLLCMQTGCLTREFNKPLDEADFLRAAEIFQLTPEEGLEPPEWLDDNDPTLDSRGPDARKGRTYLATRTLPNGQGAFAYVAVSLEDEEPKWLGGGEGVFDRHMEMKYKEEVPEYEMEKVLARRRDPVEREKVITFYNVLLQNIEDELDEKIQPHQNDVINGLLDQLVQDLRDRDQYQPYEGLGEKHLRIELLLVLHDRIKLRISKISKRQELLDEIEQNVLAKSFFDTSVIEDDKIQLPAAMWEQAINKVPNKKNIDKLKDVYPLSLIERFVELLANYKEEIAIRMQRRHENIISQMKRELRREDEKGRKLVDEAQIACDKAEEVFQAVKAQYTKRLETEQKNRDKTKVEKSEQSQLYDQMRAALYDTQKCVEDEATRGKVLAAQIGVVTEQTEMCMKATEESIQKIEVANMDIMKNIKRLNAAIENQQKRIEQVKNVKSKKDASEQFEFFF